MAGEALKHLEIVSASSERAAELMENTTWSNDFGFNELKSICTYMRIHLAAEGDLIVSEGSCESFLCLVLKGAVEITTRDEDGRQKNIARIGRGKTFGEMALVDGQPRSASAHAAQDSTLMVLTAEGLEALSNQQPRLAFRLAMKVARDLSARLRSTSGQLVDFLEGEDQPPIRPEL